MQRRVYGKGKAPSTRCAERAFPVSLLSSRWSGLTAKLSLEANESAKSPSPSLAGQSVIVNQAGLLASVHRSSASSQRSLPSDCRREVGARNHSLLQWRDRSGLWNL